MKAYILFLAAFLLLLSCSTDDADENVVATAHQHDFKKAAVEATGLTLNGEERWQADEATNHNIQQLQEIMERHQTLAEANSIEALHELGQSLQTGLKELFLQCRMNGPAHDMLHVYLKPLLADVNTLETTADSTAAIQAQERLVLRLSQYHTYFK